MAFIRRNAAAALLLALLLLALTALRAEAHIGERAFVLLLPTGYYMAAGGFAVFATFLLLAVMPQGISDRLADWRLPVLAVRPPSPLPLSLLSFAFLCVLIAAGFWGTRDPLENPLPLTIWSLWWIVFAIFTAIVGNLWVYLNPWSGPAGLVRRLYAAPGDPPPLRYPDRLGYWPATILFLGFALFAQVDIAPADPDRLAVVVSCYWLFNFAAILLFGEDAWLERGEPFTIFFRFISRLSPLVWEPDAARFRLSLAMPGAALLDRPALPLSGVLFLLLTLSLESFDGLSETFWWLGLNGLNPLEFPGRSAILWIDSRGLIAAWVILTLGYVGAVVLGWRLAGRPGSLKALIGTLAFSIMPISLGFHFSHYLSAVLVDLQYAYAAASDPFGTGANLLGLQDFYVTTSFLNTYEGTRAIWNAQTAGIVIGHVLGILLAHELACRLIGDYRAAVISQAPLAIVMVAYTLFGLWLLSTPIAG